MIDEKRLDEIRDRAAAQAAQPAEGYYGLPLLKKPVWTWEVPVYFFIGGTAGAASVIALTAQITRSNRRLVRDARRIAAAGAVLSAPLLIADLGRPARFLYMLRVFKPQSAMSVGAWALTVFGGATTGAVLFGESIPGNIAAVFAALSGLVMATYTGVLLGATAIPVWARHAGRLPEHFAASAAGSAASMLELAGHRQRALQVIASGAACAETAMMISIEESGMIRIAAIFSGPVPLILRVFGARKAASASAILGSLLTRLAWVEAGRKSADKYHPVK